MVTKTSHCSPIQVFLVIIAMMLVASATDRQSSALDFDPDYPVGTPPILGGTGYVSQANDGDGWKMDQDWGEPYPGEKLIHSGEDWNDERGGNSELKYTADGGPAPVYAIAGGNVFDIDDSVGTNLGGGIVIEHILPNGDKIYSVYVHVNTRSGLKIGDFVGQGDQIGTIADITASGLYTHLHFEIRTKWVEPGQYWWPNGYKKSGKYASIEDLHTDGLVDPSDFIDSHRETNSIEPSGRILEWISIKRNYINLAIECKDGVCGKQDKYGHYWIEILDGPNGNPVESYGWWPKSQVNPMETLMGVPGELNGVTTFGGTPTSDPHQGKTADEEFHPRLMNTLTDQQVLDRIRDFVQSYKGEWRWTFGLGQNCRTFQTQLMNYVGLVR